jgi:hypothetical protein
MEVKLTDGRVVLVDLAKLSHKEFIAFWSPATTDEEKDAISKKWIGISFAEAEELPEADWRALKTAMLEISFKASVNEAETKN